MKAWERNKNGYYEWYGPTHPYYIEHDKDSGVTVVLREPTYAMNEPVFVGAYRFEGGALVECVGREALPDALCDEIEERWAK